LAKVQQKHGMEKFAHESVVGNEVMLRLPQKNLRKDGDETSKHLATHLTRALDSTGGGGLSHP
jgi:hypothetical protein